MSLKWAYKSYEGIRIREVAGTDDTGPLEAIQRSLPFTLSDMRSHLNKEMILYVLISWHYPCYMENGP